MRSLNLGTFQLGGRSGGRDGRKNNQGGRSVSSFTLIVPIPINSRKLVEQRKQSGLFLLLLRSLNFVASIPVATLTTRRRRRGRRQ